MSVVVRPAGEADIEGVCDLLHSHMSAKISRERWRGLLDYPWRPADAGRGMVAVDGARVVGFLGLVYADRPIGAEIRRFCNICAWYLHKDYRGRGIGQNIQRDAIDDASLTYTLVTATAATDSAFRASGFQVLDGERYLLRPNAGAGRELDLVEGAAAVAGLLEPGLAQILRDHSGFRLRHLLLSRGNATCYVVVQVSLKGEDIAYHQILFASDLEFLTRHAQALADNLLVAPNAVLAIDRRFITGPLDAEVEALRQPRLYMSRDVRPDRIDHLYNEIVLLDLKLP